MGRTTTEKKGKAKKVYNRSTCPHGMNKSYCIPCKGNGLCEHKTSKYTCAQCNKGKTKRKRDYRYNCLHGTNKQLGELCGGNGLCEHKKQKYSCAQCNKGKVRKTCPHGKNPSCYDLCDGKGLCKHKKNKYTCADCNKGKAMKKIDYTKYNCVHGKKKYTCVFCKGSSLCKHGKPNMTARRDVELDAPHCPTFKNGKYDGYCWYCFANLFPDKPAVRNYCTKENTVATFLKEKFPNVTWKCNKSVENGCSRRRPDLLLDMGSHIVITEVDKHSHVGYDPTCEEKRLGEIWGDVFHRKIVFIRFNTDEYKDEDGNNVPSPWEVNGLSVLTVKPKWKAAWEVRLDDLSLTIEHYIESSNIKEEFELVHLYY